MSSQDLTKAITAGIKSNVDLIKNDIVATSQENMINGLPLQDFMFHQFLNRLDPIEYCENVLRAHLPESRRLLHENQTALIRAVCHPKLKQVAGMMSRQAGKCFAKGTKILMANGKTKNVEDVEVGNYVMSPKGEGVLVTSLGRGTERMYEVSSLNGSYTVNKSHILSLLDENDNVININVEDYIKSNKKLYGYRMSRDFQKRESYEIKLIDKGIGNYYGFTIDSKDHLFLLGDYTVTHNTESIACFSGYLIDNFPQMRVGIFTPRQQQAEVSIGRLSTFCQMNEDKLNHKIVKLTKDKVMLDNGSYVAAVSASDQSNIEGLTFDIICLDEAQKVSDYTWSERIVPMGGACVLGSSLVLLPSGELMPIKQLVNEQKEKKIVSIDTTSTLNFVESTITDYVDSGIQQTLKITLDSGRIIQGTLDHPLLMKPRKTRVPEWTRLKDLKVGMQIAVPKSMPYFGQYENEDARLVGMLIGDGCYRKRSMVRFCGENEELWNYIEEKYPNAFKPYDSYTTKDDNLFLDGTLKGLVPIVKKAGIHGQVKREKRLPANYNSYTKEALAELLGGLFDTDGTIRIEDNRKPIIAIDKISIELIKDIQMALLKFGIHSKIQPREYRECSFGKTGELIYTLNIRGKENIENFHKNIKFLISKKQDRLEKSIQILKNHKYKIQKNLFDTDLRFEKIVSIEDGGLEHVYDLTVEGVHNFVANGIINHNTNAKLIKIGTPKTRNHFYDAVEGKAHEKWTVVKRDWTQCAQSWALGAIYLPDPNTGIVRPYSKFIVEQAMPKSLKQEMFPNNPEVWTDGNLDIEDFRTQYMLEFIDGAGKYLNSKHIEKLTDGEFEWLEHGKIGENYVAGIDFAGSNPEGDSTHITVLRITRDGVKQKVFCKEFKDTSYPEQMYCISHLFGGPHPIFETRRIFADYTGCGAAVVQTLQEEYGIQNMEGIIFNSRDRFTNSGMNMKNIMYAKWRQELENDKFKYMTKENFERSEGPGAGKNNVSFYHRMISEWADLEFTVGFSVNKKIEAPAGYHDDCCDADVLANFAALSGRRGHMPKPSYARIYRR